MNIENRTLVAPGILLTAPLPRTQRGRGARSLVAGLLMASALLVSAACSNQKLPPVDNENPTAAISAPTAVTSGARVMLDGGGSTDADGDALTFRWTQVSGRAVALSGANTAAAEFTAPAVTTAEDLQFRLMIDDRRGGTDMATATVRVNPAAGGSNLPPVANAGADQTVASSAIVTLNGNGSTDADGTIASYAWTQTAGPAVTLTGAATEQAQFTAPSVAAATTFQFQLRVTDDDGAASTDTVSVTVNPLPPGTNQSPVANAGPDADANSGDTVLLNGAGSTDPDGTIAQYAWTQTAGPMVTLSGALTVQAQFTAPSVAVATPLTFQLAVTDDDGATASDSVTITVNPPVVRGPVIVGSSACCGTSAADIAQSGNYVYFVGRGSLHIVDVSNPAAPVRVREHAESGSPVGIALTSNRAYVVSSTGLFVYDIANPLASRLLGILDVPGAENDVAVAGNFAYITVGTSGLSIVDVSNSAAPALVSTIDVASGSSSAVAVAVSGGFAYVANGSVGLHIVDVRTPTVPLLVQTIDTVGNVVDVAVAGNYAYIADSDTGVIRDGFGFKVVDISNPATASVVANIAASDSPIRVSLDTANGLAYVAEFDAGVLIIDIANPTAPFVIGTTDMPSNMRAVAAGDDGRAYALVSGPAPTLQIVDVANPTSPVRVGFFATGLPSTSIGGRTAKVAGDFAYISRNARLAVVNVSNPAAPVLTGSADTSGGNVLDIELVGNLAYVGTSGMLDIFEISNPNVPALFGSADIDANGNGVEVSGNFAFVAAGRLKVVNVANPAAPVVVTTLTLPGNASDIDVVGTLAYVAASQAGASTTSALHIVDVSNPAVPVLVSSVNTPGSANGVAVSNGRAYIAGAESGLQIIDVSNPSAPVLVGSVVTPTNAGRVTVVGNRAYVSCGESGLQVIDISNPAAPVIIAQPGVPGSANDVTVSGDHAYVPTSGGDVGRPVQGVHIFDLTTGP